MNEAEREWGGGGEKEKERRIEAYLELGWGQGDVPVCFELELCPVAFQCMLEKGS